MAFLPFLKSHIALIISILNLGPLPSEHRMTQYISSQVIYTKVLLTDRNSSSYTPFHMSEVFDKSGDSAMPVLVTASQRHKLNSQPYLFALSNLRAGPDPAL